METGPPPPGPRVWEGFTRADCLKLLSEILSISPAAAASAVASMLTGLQARIVAHTKASGETSVAWFTDNAKRVWAKIAKRLGLSREDSRLSWSTLRASMSSRDIGDRSKAVVRFLQSSVKRKWSPGSWDVVKNGELGVSMAAIARSFVPQDIVLVSIRAVESACKDPSLSNILRTCMRCSSSKEGRKRSLEMLLFAVQAKKDFGEDEMLLKLYRAYPPVIRGCPCKARETRVADDRYKELVSNSSVCETSSAHQTGRNVVVSDGNKTADLSTGTMYESGGILCPVPSSPNILIVGTDGTCDLVKRSDGGLEMTTRFLLSPGSKIEWASVEIDDKGCPFLVYGDRDPHIGCPYNTVINPEKMGTKICSLASVFEIEGGVSDSDIRRVSRRWTTADDVLFDLAEQGSSLALVATKTSRENPESFERIVESRSAIMHGATVLAAYSGDEEVRCCWGTPLGWVEALSSGEVRLATMDGPGGRLGDLKGMKATSVCVV